MNLDIAPRSSPRDAHRISPTSIHAVATFATFLILQSAAGLACAQGLSGLKGQMGSLGGGLTGGGMSSGLNGSSTMPSFNANSLSLGSLDSSSSGNIAGVLQYCIKNNYLSGVSATSLKDRLTNRIPGHQPSSDNGYRDGAKGMLDSGDGNRMDLSGGGVKAKVTRQVCAKVLDRAKSMP